MSKQINIQKNVMEKISKGKITMRPKIYFILGSVFSLLGLTTSIITSVFLVSFLRFILKSHGPMGEYRLAQLLMSFPWWVLPFVVIGFGSGLCFLKKYDFSYKKNFWLIAFGFIFSLIVAGWIIDITGLDNIWLRRGPMRNFYKTNQGAGWRFKN